MSVHLFHPPQSVNGLPPENTFYVADSANMTVADGFLIHTYHPYLFPERPINLFMNIRSKGPGRDLLMGALLLIDNLMQTNVGFWSLVWPSFLLMLGLFSSKKFSWTNAGFVLLGGYFLLKNIGLLPFELGGKVIWPALVILFGISLLADALRKPKNASYRFYNKRTGQEHHEAIHRCQVIDNEFECENCFGDGDYRITTELLRCGDVENNFGSAKLDFSGVQAVADDCHINAECNFGELKLLVPRRFLVQLSPETAFGSVQTQGQPEETVDGIITMHCEANFGSIVICYI